MDKEECERIGRESARMYGLDNLPRAKKSEIKTIKIMVGQGIVQSVDGLPDDYQYEVIECDKYGDPIDCCEDCTIPDPEEKECTDCDVPLKEKQCPQCHKPMVLADEDVEGQGKTWLCQGCKIHMALDIDETLEDAIRQTYEEPEKKPIPPARCAICGGVITPDNFSESQGVLTHQHCPEPDYGAMEAEAQAEAEAEHMAQCQAEEEAQEERDAETDYQNEMGG